MSGVPPLRVQYDPWSSWKINLQPSLSHWGPFVDSHPLRCRPCHHPEPLSPDLPSQSGHTKYWHNINEFINKHYKRLTLMQIQKALLTKRFKMYPVSYTNWQRFSQCKIHILLNNFIVTAATFHIRQEICSPYIKQSPYHCCLHIKT